MGVIELITTDILFLLNVVLLFLVAILAVKLADCGTRLNRVEESCDVLENVAEGLSDRCDAHKKSIEYLSKSVRELNGGVEAVRVSMDDVGKYVVSVPPIRKENENG